MVKITNELKKQIQQMFYAEQLPIDEVARLLGVHRNTIRYYTCEKERERKLKNAREYSKTHELSPESKLRRRKYMREYMARRYKSEPQFKAKHAESMKRWARNKRNSSPVSGETKTEKVIDNRVDGDEHGKE